MKTKWDLNLLYKSPTDPNIQKDLDFYKRNVKSFLRKWKENTRYLVDPKVLKTALEEDERLFSNPRCTKPLLYFLLLNNLNQTDTKIKAKLNILDDLYTKLENNLEFFRLNISKIEENKQREFLKSTHLKDYHHFLESLFKTSPYLLSEKEEQIFNLTSKSSFSNWVDMVSELLDKQELKVKDEDGREKNISYNEISKYLDSKNKEVRDYASKQFNKVNSKYAEIAEFEINSILGSKKVNDEYRRITRADFARHLSDDIDTEVVDTLIDVVTENFNISRKYYTTKTKLLGQKKLGYHERNVPLGDIDINYSFNKAITLIKNTFNNIDPEFSDIVNTFEMNGQYDVFSKKNKNGGGFCITMNKNLPTYILLNYQEKLNDVLTIAHESGHGIHSEMSKIQNSLNSESPISLAEVASTFFEDFVLEEILKDANQKLKFRILAQKLDSDISTIFRQVAFYNFEKELHEDFRKIGYLSKEYISKLFCKHMKAYLGESVMEDEGIKNGWIYWSHMRRFFYVYSYASGLLISKALQGMVRENRSNVKLVKEFLKSGSTKSPKELFMSMGIDLSKKDVWKKGIKKIKKSLDYLSVV